MTKQIVLDHIQRWAEELIDLSGRNRLLYFKHTKSASLEFRQSAEEVEARLGRGWRFFMPDAPPKDADNDEDEYDPGRPKERELVVVMSPRRYGPDIERGLKNLARKAQSDFLDAGLWVLYVGLGMLRWTDVDGKSVSSPLLLLPVTLQQEGTERAWTLRASDDGEPALNPALAVKLEKDFDIALPSLDDLEESSAAVVADAVRAAVADPSWTVDPIAVLTTFTFHKEVIYRDLKENAERIAAHPMVRLLAEGPTSDVAVDLDFRPPHEEQLDDLHPPEELACVMDTDSTQRQCLIAARDGHSFVMDGPPGTGKSQTIANVISQLISDGKTVLFVSEKAAALEVVQNRLAELRLDPFLLPLHSHTATRKAVAQELGKALDERPRARTRFSDADRQRLRVDRERLTSYAIAVNVVRQPLDRSLHDVIGRVSELPALSDLPIPSVDTRDLSARDFDVLVAWAEQLGRAWGPVTRGDDFVWRDLLDPTSGAGREADLRQRTSRCLEAHRRLEAEIMNVCDELRLSGPSEPASAPHLLRLLEFVGQRHPIDPSWLTVEDASPVSADVEALATTMRNRRTVEEELDSACSGWGGLPVEGWNELRRVRSALATQEPPVDCADGWSANNIHNAQAVVEDAIRVADRLGSAAKQLASCFGITAGIGGELAARLVELGRLAGTPTPPEPAWLNPAMRSAIVEARRVLSQLLNTYRARKEALDAIFNESVLELDLAALNVRFTKVHTGLRKLGSAYRADKRTLASATIPGKVSKDVLAHLDEAIEWQRLAESLSQAEARHADLLGNRYWSSRNEVDLDEIERAIEIADRAMSLAAGDISPTSLAKQIAVGSEPDPQLPHLVEQVAAGLSELAALPMTDVLDTEADPARGRDFDQFRSWLSETLAGLEELERIAGQVDSQQSGLALDEIAGVLERRANHAELQAAEGALKQRVAPFLGDSDAEDPEILDAVRKWVNDLRQHLGGPVRERTAGPLLATDLTIDLLQDVARTWEKSRDALLEQFRSPYRDDLGAELESSFTESRQLLERFEDTVADLGEWESFAAALSALDSEGWHAVTDFCVRQRVDAEHVAPLLERAVLQRWTDQVIDGDDAIRPKRAVDRDQLLDEFRRLDEELVTDTAARVINACVSRRPTSLAGQAGIIKQQAGLKRRHKPVRRLLGEAGDAALRLKPCLMMSPLSVSQFLPPGLYFDAVIFDEASQVREADAIGCIYRGAQLIVAGDPKQLPPTNFFQRSTDLDEEEADEDLLDFESVLDRCKAQGFPLLPLNWHYRSRHESLITYSNRSFYDGRLHTFPSAMFESHDLGVKHFRVDGVYERGGSRSNEVEADFVVDRVLHHRRHHPDLTLGVIALSGAQQSAIEFAVERRALSEPELRHLVSDDRLDGFFVKNLENVQGDERDLIILSLGYGPDENGKFTMNFGPMSKAGGERRLNVAVTRARRRVEVVSSFGAGDIRSDNPTTVHMARYLDYAERGVAALALDLGQSEGDVESPFEAEVLRSIRAFGFDATPQVGVAGYRIDIGVRHPHAQGSYLLGVECDGAAYHSSKVARDRDRLRQQVLEGLGWTIHRIWSTAWFADREAEEARLREAIEGALLGHKPKPRTVEPVPPEIEIEEHDFDEYPDWAWVYEEPYLAPASTYSEFTDPSSQPTLVRQLEKVVTDFGPIHKEHVLEVLRSAWRIGRAGQRIRQAFERAVSSARTRGIIEEADDFLSTPGSDVYVRVPADSDADTRPVSRVAPVELDLAILNLLNDAGTAVGYESLRTTWARLFGWRRVGSDIEFAFDDALDRLRASERLAGS